MRRCAGSYAYRQRAEEFLPQVEWRDFVHEHPHELSGGMQPRAAIACALFVERLRSEVTKAFQEQELAERLDTRIK